MSGATLPICLRGLDRDSFRPMEEVGQITAIVDCPVLNGLAVPLAWPAVSSEREGGVQLDVELLVKPTTNAVIIIMIIMIMVIIIIMVVVVRRLLLQTPVGTQKNFS
jgi:hypothetical protein